MKWTFFLSLMLFFYFCIRTRDGLLIEVNEHGTEIKPKSNNNSFPKTGEKDASKTGLKEENNYSRMIQNGHEKEFQRKGRSHSIVSFDMSLLKNYRASNICLMF